MNDEGKLIWRILLGVLVAALLLSLTLAYLQKQREHSAGREARATINSISRTVFSALPRHQTEYQLPNTIEKSAYELDIDGDTIQIKILDGDREVKKYRAGVGVKLTPHENTPLPDPGETLYATGDRDRVILSSKPVSPSPRETPEPDYDDPPEFYRFAKENPKVAVGLMAAFTYGKKRYPELENLDVENYSLKGDSLKTEIGGEDKVHTLKIGGYENEENVGLIENAWIVDEIEEVTQADLPNPSPSLREAVDSGWIYSREQAESILRNRNFLLEKDQEPVNIPDDINLKLACITTNVSTYPSWRVDFTVDGEEYVLHLAGMAWKPSENTSGFVFESDPTLEVS